MNLFCPLCTFLLPNANILGKWRVRSNENKTWSLAKRQGHVVYSVEFDDVNSWFGELNPTKGVNDKNSKRCFLIWMTFRSIQSKKSYDVVCRVFIFFLLMQHKTMQTCLFFRTSVRYRSRNCSLIFYKVAVNMKFRNFIFWEINCKCGHFL